MYVPCFSNVLTSGLSVRTSSDLFASASQFAGNIQMSVGLQPSPLPHAHFSASHVCTCISPILPAACSHGPRSGLPLTVISGSSRCNNILFKGSPESNSTSP